MWKLVTCMLICCHFSTLAAFDEHEDQDFGPYARLFKKMGTYLWTRQKDVMHWLTAEFDLPQAAIDSVQ